MISPKLLCAAASLSLTLNVAAQTVPVSSAPSDKNSDTIVLSAFTVTAPKDDGYGADDANSAGRVRMKLQNTPESISVVTRSFMDDIRPVRVLDVLQYSGGISESTIPNRLDRLSVRGFQQDPAQNSQFIDGFRYTAVAAGFGLEQANLERIEVVKGPNAIIAAAGSPGGAVNGITKSPKFFAEGSVRVQFGEYLSNRIELDTTAPLAAFGGKTLAYRLVAMAEDSDGYLGNEFVKKFFVAPSLTWRIGADTAITLKGVAGKNRVQANAVPIDNRVGTNSELVLYPGLTDSQILRGKENGAFSGESQLATLEITHKFTDGLQGRLGAQVFNGIAADQSGAVQGNSFGSATGNVDPNTGIYTPGTTWTVVNYGLPTQTVTSSPAAFPDFTNRTTGYNYVLNKNFNHDKTSVVQGDVVYQFDVSGSIHSTSVAGFALTTHSLVTKRYAGFSAPIVGSLDALNTTASAAAAEAAGKAAGSLLDQDFSVLESTRQFHFSEVLSMFKERLFLSGSVSNYEYEQRVPSTSIFPSNPVGTAVKAPSGYAASAFYVTPGLDNIKGEKTAISYGAVVKVLPDVSLFYSWKENVNPPTINNIGGTARANQYGDQYEFGTKGSLLGNRVNVTATYFNIAQHNVFVYDGLSQKYFPLGDVSSKGYEVEFNARVNANVNLLGQWTSYKARDSFGRKIRGVADDSHAVAVRYGFTDGSLKGLWFLLGANYLGKRAGDIPGSINIQAATARPGLVLSTVNGRALNGAPVEPTFYVPARTILTLNAGYTLDKHWSFWMKVENLTDKDYIGAGIGRNAVFPANPRNFTGSVTYKF